MVKTLQLITVLCSFTLLGVANMLYRAEEQDDYADGSSRNFLQDVLNGPTLTKTRSGQQPALQFCLKQSLL